MDQQNFIDLATKARELGVSDGTLRARIMSGDVLCFTYVTNVAAYADAGYALPAHDDEQFPTTRWVDHGSPFSTPWLPSGAGPGPVRCPWYHLSGWVQVTPDFAAEALTHDSVPLDGAPIGIRDLDDKLVSALTVTAPPDREWVAADTHEWPNGGYMRDVPVTLHGSDLFARAANDTNKALSSRKEQSYLGIIEAMRALLRSKDGGGFPSDAKIIDQLVERHKGIAGVTKRTLEGFFADAKREVGDLLPPK